MCQAPRGRAHPLQPSGITQQGGDGIGQPHPFQLCFFYHDGGAGTLQRLSVDPLMIVSGARERDKNRRLACGCDFRDRARARPAQQQIGSGKDCGHVRDEGRNFSGQASLLIRSLRVIIVTFPGMMDDLNAGNPSSQRARRIDHDLVDRMSALTSAKNEQSRLVVPRRPG